MDQRARRSQTTLATAYLALLAIFFLGFSALHYSEVRQSALDEVKRQAGSIMRWVDRNLAASNHALLVVAEHSATACRTEDLAVLAESLLRTVAVERVAVGNNGRTLCAWEPGASGPRPTASPCHDKRLGDGLVDLRVASDKGSWATATVDTSCLLAPLAMAWDSTSIVAVLLKGADLPSGPDAFDAGWFAPNVFTLQVQSSPVALKVEVPELALAQTWARQLPLFAALFAAFGAIGWYGPVTFLRNRASIEGQVASALKRGDFFLLYLPTVDLENGEWISVEALLRWNHPVHGLLQPASFVPWIEKSPQIYETTRWVMQQAAQDLTRFRTQAQDITVGVNIPPHQLADPRLVTMATDAFGDGPRALGCLIIELIERETADYASAPVQDVVRRLKERGTKFALDDFGVGFSNFASLQLLGIDYIKVDKSFLHEADWREDGPNPISSMVHLASVFGASVVAEGVETERQLERLRNLGIRMAQGFLFSRPIEAEAIVATLRDSAAARVS